MWLFVGLSMVVIVAIWAILLPVQLRSLPFVNNENIKQWHVIKEEQGAESLRDALGDMKANLSRLELRVEEEVLAETGQTDIEGEGEVQKEGHLPLTEEENNTEKAFELLKVRLESNISE